MRNGHEKNSSPKECDVGLGLKMPSSITTPYYNYQHLLSNTNNLTFVNAGGGPIMNTSNDIYEEAAAGDTSSSSVLPMTFFRPTGGVYGKAPFTASQWQELERQKIIHKYMMANITVPPELLLPISKPSLVPPVSQSHSQGLELRFPSGGSDLEPWRCKRTDGKKWRCSRDVAPDQKYCERHAHKSKARSRKPVETSPHKFINNKITPQQATFQRPTSLFPTMASAASANTTPYNDQTRNIEWFMRCGANANNQQQWQQVYQTSAAAATTTLDFSRHKNTDHQHPQYEDKQPDYAGFNNEPYIPDTNFGDAALELNANKTTRHFIDAWEKEGLDQIERTNHKGKKFSPSSSLSLSMSAGNAFDDEEFNYNGYLGIGTMTNNSNSDRGIMNMNPISWMNNNSSPPGGPLGEALCLGNASTARGNLNLTSPRHHGYYSNNSNTNTNSSSCSKSSCDDGSHALNFIG